MRKYGIENFNISVLESGKMTKERADELEEYYIKKFNCYHYGYNMTYGGEGKPTIASSKTDIILDLYQNKKMTINEICDELKHDQRTVTRVLQNANVTIRQSNEYRMIKVQMLDKKTSEILKEFDSVVAAATYLGCVEPDKTHIYACIKGKRKSTLGYAWRAA